MQADKFFPKLRNTNYIYIILIIGAAIMLISSFGDNSSKTPKDKSEPCVVSEEDKLCKILSEIDGVGEVSVMITYYTSTEKSFAYEKKTDLKKEASGGAGAESYDEKAVMSGGEPVVVREIYPEVKGVVVIADGGGASSVRQAICEAVSTSLGIAMHKICVLPKSK